MKSMIKAIQKKEYLPMIFLSVLVLLSRIPFLDAGYGVEEDSWGIAVAAYHTQLYGVMEASRLPGHPVNEWVYGQLWGYGPWLYNFLSALCSAICFILFYGISKHMQLKQAALAALALAFTPVVYINSTCTIDYVWAMMFALAAFYALLQQQLIVTGIMLGLAVGCRINSAVLFIPFLCWLFYSHHKQVNFKQYLFFTIVCGITACLCYLPVYLVYGEQFFSYSDQFPYPNWPKIIYKAGIGVIGLPALLVLIWLLARQWVQSPVKKEMQALHALFFSLLFLQIIAYLMLPQKSAYLMLLVPFGILWLSKFLSASRFRIYGVVQIFSSFFMSINLTDSYRGATSSGYSLTKTVAGQEIFFDVLTGPVHNDYSKRLNKLNYTGKVIQRAKKINYPTVVICGWWFNQILIQQMEQPANSMVKFAFYLHPSLMEMYAARGYQIYYLSEQATYNDLFYRKHETENWAQPFFP
jgi:hypothetical protein